MPDDTKSYAVALMARYLHHGGTERQLAETALGLDRTRFEPHVLTLREGGLRWDQLLAEGLPISSLGLNSVRRDGFRAALRLRAYVRTHNIRLVHAFDMPSVIWAAPVLRALGGPVVVTSQRGHRSLYDFKIRELLRLSDHLAHGIVVNCDFLGSHLQKDFGVPGNRIHVAYNGIDTSTFHDAPAGYPPSLAGAGGVIGTVSVLRPEKGIETLIEAFGRIAPSHPGWRLAIVGSGTELERLQAAARRSQIAESCVFNPTTNDVISWLRVMDIFVLPTLNEALSNALMEAMAAGCAPVASRVGGNFELVRDDENGLLFNAGDAAELAVKLERLIQDPDLRERFGGRSSQLIQEKFSRTAAAKRMEVIYELLLASSPAPSPRPESP